MEITVKCQKTYRDSNAVTKHVSEVSANHGSSCGCGIFACANQDESVLKPRIDNILQN